jgi:hypothetical protein
MQASLLIVAGRSAASNDQHSTPSDNLHAIGNGPIFTSTVKGLGLLFASPTPTP